MRLRSWLPVVAILAALAAGLTAGCGTQKKVSADRFDVAIDVQRDGSARITETVTYRFAGGPFSQVTREIPTRATDGIDSVSVSENGSAFAKGNKANQFGVSGDSQIKVTWQFTPTRDAVRTFSLSYRVLGLVRQDGKQDAVMWGAVPPKHEYPIASSAVTVTLPSAVSGVTRAEVLGGQGHVGARDGKPVFDAQEIDSDGELTVGVWFAHGIVTNVPPKWQALSVLHSERAPVWWIAGAALAALLALALLWVWHRFGRQVTPRPIPPQLSPPDDLAPGLAGALFHNGAQWRDVVSTVMDLTRRGLLRMEERDRKATLGKRRTEFYFVRGDTRVSDAGLKPFETAILEVGFGLSTAPGEVPATQLASGLYAQQSRLCGLLNETLREAGLLEPRRERTRRWFGIAALGVGALAIALLVFTLVALRADYGAYPLMLAVPLLFAAGGLLLMGTLASRVSDEGRRRSAYWLAFVAQLRSIANGKVYPESLPSVESHLPYVIAAGFEKAWGKRFAHVKEPAPAWFRSMARDGVGPEGWMGAWVVAMSDATSVGTSGGAAAGGAAGGGSSSVS